MPAKKKRPGGSQIARAKGLRGIIVHLAPDDYDRIKAAAALDGRTMKEWSRRALMEALKRGVP